MKKIEEYFSKESAIKVQSRKRTYKVDSLTPSIEKKKKTNSHFLPLHSP